MARIYESVRIKMNWMDIEFEYDCDKHELLCKDTGSSIPMTPTAFENWKINKRREGWRFILYSKSTILSDNYKEFNS